jgi:predicted DNA-binding transcriptional regulator AlpA
MTPMDEIISPDEGLMRAETIAALLDCTKQHVFAMAVRKEIPAPVLRGNARFTRWRAADIRAYLADPAGWMERT